MDASSLRLFAGTSGWAYPTWKPGFYPEKLPARRFLEHYGSRLNSVEVNYTFRALPTEAQLAGWLAAVPPGFRFSFKAPETVTHRKRLRECGDAVDRFLTALAPVRQAGALGCLLFQLPPNFKADVSRLAAFLAQPQMANAGRVCFEFRNESWFTEETWAVLREVGAAVCIAESDDLRTPEVQTAPDFACYRLRKESGYDAAAIADHAASFRALAESREVYVYYKHEDAPDGPLAAESMLLQATGAV
jgi:uncharacterized protein YecE (DUF72 family)